jgi:hypothetical protein
VKAFEGAHLFPIAYFRLINAGFEKTYGFFIRLSIDRKWMAIFSSMGKAETGRIRKLGGAL